jgi:hypothetical protein
VVRALYVRQKKDPMQTSLQRRRLMALVALCCVPLLCSAAPEKQPREFAFMLGRFSYLFLTSSQDSFRLCHVSDGKDGELMRTSFSGFKLLNAAPSEIVFEQRYDYPYPDGDPHVIRLTLNLSDSPGVATNRSINFGHWKMTVTGSGGRFEVVKKFLLENRVEEFWTPQDSMIFRGEPALKDWKADYIHQ